VKFRPGSRSPQVIIRDREGSGLSEDAARLPSQYLKADVKVSGNPLRDNVGIYHPGTNGKHVRVERPWYKSL